MNQKDPPFAQEYKGEFVDSDPCGTHQDRTCTMRDGMDHLERIDTPKKFTKRYGSLGQWPYAIYFYRCRDCGTKWRHDQEPKGDHFYRLGTEVN